MSWSTRSRCGSRTPSYFYGRLRVPRVPRRARVPGLPRVHPHLRRRRQVMYNFATLGTRVDSLIGLRWVTRMPRTAGPRPPAGPLRCDHRYRLIAFDWDGTAVTSRAEHPEELAPAMERLLGAGITLVVITGTNAENVSGQIAPLLSAAALQRLFLMVNRGSEVYAYDTGGELARLWPRARRPRRTRRSTDAAGGARPARRRARPRDRHRPQPPQPAQDRPDPDARMGGSAQGADRRAARGRRPSGSGPSRAGSARSSTLTAEAGDRRGPPRRPHHHRRQAHRGRPHRQVRLDRLRDAPAGAAARRSCRKRS